MPILALISNLSTKYFRTVLRTPPRDFEPHMITQIAALFTSVQGKYVGVWISLTLVTLKGALKRGRSEALPQKQYSHWSYGRFMYEKVFSILDSWFWMERKNKIIWDEYSTGHEQSSEVKGSFYINDHLEQSKHLKGQLDPPVSDLTFFCTKGGWLDPPLSDVTFLHQRRSVGSPCQWRDVFAP